MTLGSRLGRSRLGLGLAAVGRPGYLTSGRDQDLPGDRTLEAMRQRSHELLEAAYAAGVRYVDVARSYGLAEAYLAGWLPGHSGVVVGSKWGQIYTGGWRIDAQVHEIKDHGVGTFDNQVARTRELLENHLDIYQIHSLTVDSPALTDTALHERLAELAEEGVTIGFSTTGAGQADTIRAALDVQVGGRRLFRSVQTTWNLLESSAGAALAEAHRRGCLVIVKEALANGRLAGGAGDVPPTLRRITAELGTTPDAVAIAAVLHQPWADIVLSGAATVAQLHSNLHAAQLTLGGEELAALARLAEPPEAYWKHRAELPWT